MNTAERLGHGLRRARELLEISATEVARRAGMSRSTVWRIERGQDVHASKLLLYLDALRTRSSITVEVSTYLSVGLPLSGGDNPEV